jgi:hypothetical protein
VSYLPDTAVAPAGSAGRTFVPVASRAASYYGGLFGSSSTQTFRTKHKALANITGLSLVYGNTYGTSAGPQGDGPGDLTVSCSVEVPLGTIYRGYFGQTRAGVCKPGGRLQSDPIAVFIPKGSYFFIRTYVSGNWPQGITSNYARGIGQDTVGDGQVSDSNEGIASPSTTDVTASGSVNSSYIITYSPTLILGTTPDHNVPCIGGDGDSIQAYSNEAPDMGWFVRGVNAYPHVRLSTPGETAQQWAANGTAASLIESRLLALRYFTHCIHAHGRNDISGGRTVAQLQADWLTIWGRLAPTGIPQYQGTITPKTTSTDNWTTLGNQTATSNESNRVAANAWLRDGAPIAAGAAVAVGTVGASRCPVFDKTGAAVVLGSGPAGHPLAAGGILEVTDIVESSRDSGKWAVDRVRTFTDGAMSTGATPKVLSSAAQAVFTQADVGKGCFVAGAGTAGATLAAVLGSVQSATAATHALSCITTVTGATVQLGSASYDGTHPNGDRHRDIAAMVQTVIDAAVAAFRG